MLKNPDKILVQLVMIVLFLGILVSKWLLYINISPACQPPPKYRTAKNSKYRRYRLFSTGNIGGFKENYRRFIKIEGQL